MSEITSTATRPRVCLGTMTFSADGGIGQVKKEEALAILKCLINSKAGPVANLDGKVLIDTARVYQSGTPEFDTETVLGEIFEENPDIRSKCHIATKAHPMLGVPLNAGKGNTKASVIAQATECIRKLRIESIDLFYLHMPDIDTDIDDTLAGIDELHKSGKIKEFGLSNFPAWKVVDIYYRCKNKNYIVPTVYQGMYNAITRDYVREVVPVLREFNMRAMMYNPLAGGLLTGRYTKMEEITSSTVGRFSADFPWGKMYVKRYGKAAFIEAINHIKSECDKENISMVNAAFRWVLNHSYISAKHDDGIIFGVSSLKHFEMNIECCEGGPLPANIVDAIDQAAKIAYPSCPSYFRGYGPESNDITNFLKQFGQDVKHVM